MDVGCLVRSPTITIPATISVYESDGAVPIQVTLSQTNTQPVTVSYATANGTATAPKDYKSLKGTLTIPAGSLSGSVSVALVRDNLLEGAETFSVQFSRPVNATINGDGKVNVTILSGTAPLTKANVQGNTVEGPVVSRLTAKVTPNPAPYYFNLAIQSPGQEPVTIRVMDLLGRVVETKQSVPANGTIRLGHKYHKGIYYAELTQGKERVMVRLLKFND